MSFTPFGGDGCKSGIADYRFPPLPECCVNSERRCASKPFFYQKPLIRRREYDYQLTYDNWQAYMPPEAEDRVLPAMAFWFYCDHIPDLPGHKKTSVVPAQDTARPTDPWPPLPQGRCPPPRECNPCGPGPWANPELRRFFYMDCQ
ncbi:unnamed protein product [Candidula unifasciata]|uniref:Uncharacterized protein n=1 Tax=Candidula unifasciata TaxID=100452 RepID=A0A8S3YW39_9EUPU|nr:unnamed protein product [Candidula unifasciata]